VIYSVVAATALPLLVYVLVGLARTARAKTIDDYFIYSQRVSVQDYANTSVGYALQMAAMFLFAYWGILYGLVALWTPICWALGFFLLWWLLPKFMPYHERHGTITLHQYLADTFRGGRTLQTTAAAATIIGLWGTMMAEIDYVLLVYSPVIKDRRLLYLLGAVFLAFGVIYIIQNGYKAEIHTERLQVPIAYMGLISVLILALPNVWRHGGPRPYRIILSLLVFTFAVMLVGKSVQGWTWRRPFGDPQS
jgi:Na+/proline symporter